jgi:hypothetical protein
MRLQIVLGQSVSEIFVDGLELKHLNSRCSHCKTQTRLAVLQLETKLTLSTVPFVLPRTVESLP